MAGIREFQWIRDDRRTAKAGGKIMELAILFAK